LVTDMIGSTHQRAMLGICACAVVVLATVVRTAPIMAGGKRLQRQCVSEDGYLMLTIARNMALGRGFSVSDGLIPSNGTQPLAALLYTLCFMCVAGDKLQGLYYVVGVQVVTSVLTAMLLFVFVRRYLYKGPYRTIVALLAACLWYAGPSSIVHTQNGLETGLYALLILLSIALYDAAAPRLRDSLGPSWCFLLGFVLGLTFLGRNDACLLIGVMLVVHLILAYRRQVLRRAFIQAVIIGATSVMVALPWLWYNVSRFGHIVPVSGRAESSGFVFGDNLLPAFAAVVENMLLVIRIPQILETNTYVQLLCGGILLLLVCLAILGRRWLVTSFSAGIGVLACFICALFLYYSLCFRAGHFLGRYLFSMVMLSSVLAAALVVSVAQRTRTAGPGVAITVAGLSASLVCAASAARVYIKGLDHLHFQVVDWVATNVPEDSWVGAIQTGTLGYYHDRTINLDGKVDPYALTARQQGRTHEYLVERNVEYIVDWIGIAQWANLPGYAANYQLVLSDPERNLAVLHRRPSHLKPDQQVH